MMDFSKPPLCIKRPQSPDGRGSSRAKKITRQQPAPNLHPAASLLGLPFEVRRRILRELLISDEPLEFIRPPTTPPPEGSSEPEFVDAEAHLACVHRNALVLRPPPPPKPPLKERFELHLWVLLVNQQLRQEALDLLYTENTMSIRVTGVGWWDPSNLSGLPLLTVYNHLHEREYPGACIIPWPRWKISNLYIHILLDERCLRHRVAAVLRHLVKLLNKGYGRDTPRKVTIVYDDQDLDDDSSCWTCHQRPSKCPCPAEVAKREHAKAESRKVLQSLKHLRRVKDVKLLGHKRQQQQSTTSPDSRPRGSYDLEIPEPVALIEHMKLGIHPHVPIDSVYSSYWQLLQSLQPLSTYDWVNEIARKIEFPNFIDRRVIRYDVEYDKENELFFKGEDTDDVEWASDWNPSCLFMCPEWLRPEMRIVRKAMIRDDWHAFRELREKIMERVDMVNKAIQGIAYARDPVAD